MSKTTVQRLFIGSLLAAGAGIVIAISAVWLAIANDVFVMNGQDIVAIQGSALAWILGGARYRRRARLRRRVDRRADLVDRSPPEHVPAREQGVVRRRSSSSGSSIFGFFAMIAYLIAGPDGTSTATPRRAQVSALA